MRVSVKKEDPGYREDIEVYGTKVFLDGKEIHHCFTADEETGEAFCYVTKNGRDVLAEDGESILTVILKGKIEIVLSKRKNK